MILLLIVLAFLLFGGFGSYYTNRSGAGYYRGGGIGVGTVLVILLVLFLLGYRL